MKWYYQNDCITIVVPMKRNAQWQQSFLLTSDGHIDSSKCDLTMFKRHLSQLEEKDAYLIDNGDLFDCMGGKYDKRSNKGDILPKFQVADYFDALVDHGEEILKPYSKRIVMLADGNHELSILQRHEVDLIKNLQKRLNAQDGINILKQGYAGWIRFIFEETKAKGSPTSYAITMYRTHGNGGNSPVTKGVIQTARRQDMIEADLFISGHIHTNYVIPRPMMKLDKNGNVKIHNILHHQIGTYKDSKSATWESMVGLPAPSLGGSWLTFKWDSQNQKIHIEITPTL